MMTLRKQKIPAAVFTLFCCVALAQDRQEENATKLKSPETRSDLVVVRVSGEPITETQVLSAIDQLARQKPLPPDRLNERNKLLFKDALDGLIVLALLRNQIRQQNIIADSDKIDQEIRQISQQFPSQADFQKALQSQGVTQAELRKSIADRMEIQQLMDSATKEVPAPTDEEIRKFYEENPDKFVRSEQVRASHILLRVDPKSSPEQKAEIKKKLEAIRSDIESKAISFKDAAAKYSEDPSNAKSGGDLGFFARGVMVKPFEEAAFSTKPGTLSPVVETQFGYHIIQVAEYKPAGLMSLEEAKASIKTYLHQLAKQKVFQKYLDELRSKAHIETFMTQEEFAKRHSSK